MKYGLPERTVAQICAALAQYPAVERAVLYGSRAKGNYQNRRKASAFRPGI